MRTITEVRDLLTVGRAALVAIVALAAIASACSSKQDVNVQPAAAPGAAGDKMPEALRSGLARINYYRASVQLPPIIYDPAHDEAAFKHARYVIKNNPQAADFNLDRGTFTETGREFDAAHENWTNPWFSNEGANAAYQSWTMTGSTIASDATVFVDAAMAAPFSALLLLDPQMATVSYGDFCENGECALTVSAVLGLDRDVYASLYESGNDIRRWNPRLGRMPFTAGRLLKPIEFPPANSNNAAMAFDGRGWPDALSACPGYQPPLGQPIIFQLGTSEKEGGEINFSASSISENGRDIDKCTLTAKTYQNLNPRQANFGKNVLSILGALILIPKHPLKAGHKYSVSVTADNKESSWSFTLSSLPAPTLQASN